MRNFDRERVEQMLDHVRDMDPKAWDQTNGHLSIGKRCWTLRTAAPACAGAIAAFALGLPANVSDGHKVWTWSQGSRGLAKVLGVSQGYLDAQLHKNGASRAPFMAPKWRRYIYDVFRDTIEDITGYRHNSEPEVHDFPLLFDDAIEEIDAASTELGELAKV